MIRAKPWILAMSLAILAGLSPNLALAGVTLQFTDLNNFGGNNANLQATVSLQENNTTHVLTITVNNESTSARSRGLLQRRPRDLDVQYARGHLGTDERAVHQ